MTELVAPAPSTRCPRRRSRRPSTTARSPGDAVTGTYAAAHEVFDRLAAVGVDFADVTQVLEDEGVDKFIASWHDLQGTVKTALEDALQATR